MDKKKFHFYYGIVLLVVGFAVFFRIPQLTPQIESIEFFRQKIFVVKSCLYILGAMLVVSGVVRIYKNYK